MEIEKTKEIIRGFFKAVNEGDAQKVLEVYYHPDIRYWIPGNSKVSGFHNLESLGSVGFELLKAFPEGLQITIEDILVEGSLASVPSNQAYGLSPTYYLEWHYIDGPLAETGLGDIVGEDEDGDGTDYDNEYHYFLRFQGEKIIEAREYMDTQKSLRMVEHADKVKK